MFSRILALLMLVSAAFTQQPLGLDEAVRRALEHHPDLAVAGERVAEQEGLRLQARKTYNPTLNLQWENFRAWQQPGFQAGEDSDIYGFLQQQWELFGKRRRRVEQASAQVRVAELEREQARNQVSLRVKQAYWQALAAQHRLKLFEENLLNFQKIIEYHEARVREGAMAEADLIRVRLEGERLALDRNEASLAAIRSRMKLQLAMGEEQFPPVTLTEPIPEKLPEPPFPLHAAEAVSRRIEVRIRQAAVDESAAGTALARANARPDLTWLAGYKRSGPYNTVVLGAQVPLTIRDRNEGNIAAASAEERYAASLLRASRQAVLAEAQAAIESYQIYRRQLEHTLPALREQALETATIAEAAYREGGADLLRFLDAQRVRIEAQQLYMDARVNYELAIVDLEQALGIPQGVVQP
ncbi:MAG: TolC family protein [Bryobacterales bacterium]|nr:TolC family protein [Bryobacterales bacterium]